MWFIQILILIIGPYQYGLASLPYRVQTPTFRSSEQCASQQAAATALENFKRNLSEVFRKCIIGFENIKCNCRDQDSSWTRVAYLNMNDTSQTCPSAWATINTPVRACGRRLSSYGSCNSVLYSTNRLSYTQVCGRINGYQFNSPNAFNSSVTGNIGLDSWYVDGVSLTYGPPGSRTHVWTFANAYYETVTNLNWKCACMLSNYSEWPYTVPSFVGHNYFCATGSRGDPGTTVLHNNPLWDGVGCTGSNTCCQFNQPPWFCRTLPTSTSDDLEVRICADQMTSNENTYISNIELYVR